MIFTFLCPPKDVTKNEILKITLSDLLKRKTLLKLKSENWPVIQQACVYCRPPRPFPTTGCAPCAQGDAAGSVLAHWLHSWAPTLLGLHSTAPLTVGTIIADHKAQFSLIGMIIFNFCYSYIELGTFNLSTFFSSVPCTFFQMISCTDIYILMSDNSSGHTSWWLFLF